MNLFTRMMIFSPLGLCVAMAGGTATAAGEETAPPVDEPSVQASHLAQQQGEAKEETEPHAHGISALVGAALAKLQLSDQQRSAVEQLGKTVAPKEEEVHEARHALLREVADQLRSGELDECALKSGVDKVVKAREDASPVLRKAFEDLHGILTPEQRVEFADAVENRLSEAHRGSGKWLEKMGKDLNLSDDQKQKIGDVIDKAKPQIEEEMKTTRAVFDAFKKDEFRVEDVAPIADVGEKTRERIVRMFSVAKEIRAILTPEQRTMLAEKIEKRGAAKEAPQQEEQESQAQPQEPQEGGGQEHVGEAQQGIVAGGFGARGIGGVGYGARGFGARGVGGVGYGARGVGYGGYGGLGYGGYRGVGYGARGVGYGGYGGVGYGGVGYGGLGWGGGYSSSYVSSSGYATGYPFVGGWGPGIW